jgi:hypothetical protein
MNWSFSNIGIFFDLFFPSLSLMALPFRGGTLVKKPKYADFSPPKAGLFLKKNRNYLITN